MPSPSHLVDLATADNWSRKIGNRTLRHRIFLKWLMTNNMISKGHTGKNLGWKEIFKDLEMVARGAATELVYNEPDILEEYVTDPRGYAMPLRLGEKTRVTNSGPDAIFDYMAELTPIAEKSAAKALNKEMLQRDGSGTTTNFIEGLGTIHKFNTPTVATDRVARPNSGSSGTYATRNTNVGNEGTWSTDLAAADRPNTVLATDWPLGSGTSEYDAASLLGLASDATTWDTDSREWADNCDVVLSTAADWQRNRRGGHEYGPDIWIMGVEWWTIYKQYQKTRFRNLIPHPQGRDLGFASDTLIQDGIMICQEYEMPARRVYGINKEAIELCLWKNPYRTSKNSLFYSTGWMEDNETGDLLLRLALWGNNKLWPGGQVDIREYAVAE